MGIQFQPPAATAVTVTPTPAIPLTSPLRPEALKGMLALHPNRLFAQYVVDGATHGFHIDAKLSIGDESIIYDNLPSAAARPQVIREWLSKELQAKRIHGPFPEVPFGCMANPIGTVPKSKREFPITKFRTINHFSYAYGNTPSVNDSIDPADHSLTYMSFLDLAAAARRMGPGCFVAKVDIANAFRNLATHPSAHRYGFLVIDGKVYLDGAINFGCRASPKVFRLGRRGHQLGSATPLRRLAGGRDGRGYAPA